MNSVKVIAEVGSNYNGDLHRALEYIKAAKACGADVVKFQTLCKEKLVSPLLWSDGIAIDNPVYKLFSNLELSSEWHYRFKETADAQGIEFMSTPFHLEAVDLLEAVGVRTYKIASGDITFKPLLEAVGRTGKSVILSTGGSSLADVERALGMLKRSGAGEITLLHCVSNYPPQWSEMNLRVLVTMKEAFGLPVGISDHTPGALVPIAAVALGATVIEKHVTFNRTLPGPDHPFAMTMEEFGEMIRQVRCLEEALGTGVKEPTASEQAKQERMRRGIYNPVTFVPTDETGGIWLRPSHDGIVKTS
ncbi:MAG: N-acetylneuraminate synthase family protein [Syntrophales bacterium]|nr:N-acetylneuraminate synthase family protein [Syntrophales bacterium]